MRAIVFTPLLILFTSVGTTQPTHTNLMTSLGCARCHGGLPPAQPLPIPHLSDAGLRYQPAYLFEFLQNPVRVRRHIGPARMPNFHLTPPEAAALVAFLGTQRSEPSEPSPLAEALARPIEPAAADLPPTERELCLRCHTLNGTGGVLAAELNEIGFRLQSTWVRHFLADPEKFGVPPGVMPGLLTAVTPAPPGEPSAQGEVANRIRVISDYLFSLGAARRKQLEEQFTRARGANADAGRGRDLFVSLNCAACHPHPTITPRQNQAPDLSGELSATQTDWLRDYLKEPQALRPAGYQPGDGGRMPNFNLSEKEIAQVIGELNDLPTPPLATNPFVPTHLSAFSQTKVRALLLGKLSCLGCHRLGAQGGRIGPALTDVGKRRTPDYIRDMVHDPRLRRPHTIMPKVPLADELEGLLVSFLILQTNGVPPSEYLSRLQHALPGPELTGEGPAQIYRSHCALCHGPKGQGDGFNAAYLPVRPTAHADAAYMSQRADATLFDGISGGGAILNKSHYMPPWGATLSPAEINGLVQHLRALCGCPPPAWSVK